MTSCFGVSLPPAETEASALRVVQVTFDFFAGIASIGGLVAGIVGVVFSIKSWKKATAAEQAAIQAREAVRHGNAAEEIGALADKAKELLAYVQQNQFQAACPCGRDLVAGINKARQRWQAYFASPESILRLEKTAREVEKISIALSTRPGNIPPDEQGQLLNFCHRALRILSDEAGALLSRAQRR